MRLDARITHCLDAERVWMAKQETKSRSEFNLTLETPINIVIKESGTPFTATGKVDYALWYSVKKQRPSLFILEAKAPDYMSSIGKFQCLAYMSEFF